MIPPTGRRALRRASAVAVAIVAVVALAGCLPAEPAPHPTASGLATPLSVAPQSPLVVPAVLAYCPLEGAVHFSGYWLPTDEVFICRADGRHATDGVTTYGPWESASRIEKPAALLKAYRVSDAVASRTSCTFLFRDPDLIWVHRNGVTTSYYAPVDGCGNPSRAATDAYRAAKRTAIIAVDRGAPDSSKKDPNG